MNKQLLNRTAAAAYLGFDRRTLMNWEKQGYGPKPVRLPSGMPYYSLKSLDEFISVFTQGQDRSSDD